MEKKVKTIKEIGSEIEGMLASKDVNFNDVRKSCLLLESRLTSVKTELTWGSLPKTKAAALKELEALRLRITRAAAIFKAAQTVIRYRRSERAAFARKNNPAGDEAL